MVVVPEQVGRSCLQELLQPERFVSIPRTTGRSGCRSMDSAQSTPVVRPRPRSGMRFQSRLTQAVAVGLVLGVEDVDVKSSLGLLRPRRGRGDEVGVGLSQFLPFLFGFGPEGRWLLGGGGHQGAVLTI